MIETVIKLKNSIGINVKYSIKKKPAVLFLHFSGGTLNMWDGVLPIFEKDFRIITPDFRGHGKSDKPETGYHIDDMAHDMYLLLQELDIKECHVVGSSLGAEVGLSLAVSYPGLVLSLVCEGALYNEFGEHGLFNGSEDEIEKEKKKMQIQLSERKLPLFNTPYEYIEEHKTSFVKQGLWNEHFSTFLKSTIQETEDGHFTSHYQNYVRNEYIQKYWDVKFEEYYENVECPILFLPSKEEWANEKIKNNFKAFTKLVNTFEVKLIENSVHAYVWMQFPTIVAEEVRLFISKQKGFDSK
ncbi:MULTISPECIES: alpha/beta fold hydrolase [unclassified Bacillus (in: firmicutes)]|uniref:alpha/beta fold hydrolase n=1 Tax=unclassified Bacillus (in: firmicutes) TaxID=185979 RepID=UPI0008DF6890|nr:MULTISPECIES: alpha/beta hydrolase [unclassified Bacillus (in: firmicutes)]SFI25164.1 2-succinyl-6-hydroxy-2,4-cyclohexadiene-1-carboxylate synthase [Bacillus sp. 71mf]SFS41133.1 2-succinyl-6-hydroxy-2,4-cyclohexadiene-1-carboxylate synthase [Bacillus sp. 103mf]